MDNNGRPATSVRPDMAAITVNRENNYHQFQEEEEEESSEEHMYHVLENPLDSNVYEDLDQYEKNGRSQDVVHYTHNRSTMDEEGRRDGEYNDGPEGCGFMPEGQL